MSKYGSIYIEKGPGGFGGPLVVTPTGKRNKVMYILGEVDKPPCLDKIVELSGMTPVDGYETTVPEEEIALAIVDCGGTLRCGIYPKKRIPTINIMPVGAAGPLANFIVEDIYASAVGPDQIRAATEEEVRTIEEVRLEKDAGRSGDSSKGEKKGKGLFGRLRGK